MNPSQASRSRTLRRENVSGRASRSLKGVSRGESPGRDRRAGSRPRSRRASDSWLSLIAPVEPGGGRLGCEARTGRSTSVGRLSGASRKVSVQVEPRRASGWVEARASRRRVGTITASPNRVNPGFPQVGGGSSRTRTRIRISNSRMDRMTPWSIASSISTIASDSIRLLYYRFRTRVNERGSPRCRR